MVKAAKAIDKKPDSNNFKVGHWLFISLGTLRHLLGTVKTTS